MDTEGKPQVFRSPIAVIVWWVWLLFAVGNMIDLLVQGGGHDSVIAGGVLVFVTGIVYVAAQIPRVVSGSENITISNPLRDHVIGWGTVTKIDTKDLLQVHCEWPADGGTRNKTFYAWAVQHTRRREASQANRELRRSRRGLSPSRPDSTPAYRYGEVPQSQPQIGTAQYAVQMLNARLDTARLNEPEAVPPVTSWDKRAIIALAVGVLTLLITVIS